MRDYILSTVVALRRNICQYKNNIEIYGYIYKEDIYPFEYSP